MAYRVVVQPCVESFLLRNAQWWARNRSVSEAERWLQGIRASIESLTESPDRHALAPEDALTSSILREIYFGLGGRLTHRIVFRVTGMTVDVLAVRHTAQQDLTAEDLDI